MLAAHFLTCAHPCYRSLLLNQEEMFRIENAQENFSALVSRAVIKLASFYDVSASDVLTVSTMTSKGCSIFTATSHRAQATPTPNRLVQVCNLVAMEVLSNNRLKLIGPGAPPLKVGRLDSTGAAAENMLASPLAGPNEFVDFWAGHKFTPEEAMALMGSHSLLRDQGCLVKGTEFCDPFRDPSGCKDVRMFKWGELGLRHSMHVQLTVCSALSDG